jgi:molybdopterin-binding protein
VSENSLVRIEVGLEGGQILSALVTTESADELEKAVSSAANAALSLQAQDGTVQVVVPKVLYVKRFAREGRVGFGQ